MGVFPNLPNHDAAVHDQALREVGDTSILGPRVAVVVNRRAGQAAENIGLMKNLIETHLALHTVSCRIAVVEPSSIEDATESAIAENVSSIIVAGGDGSVRSVARKLVHRNIALGVVPLGTLNLFARDIGMPIDIEQAIAAMPTCSRTTQDAASLNGDLYLCNALIGLPTLFSERRRDLRGLSIAQRVSGYLSIASAILRRRHRLRISMRDERGTRVVRALSLAVSNGPYDASQPLVIGKTQYDTGLLGVYVSRHRDGASLATALLKAIIGRGIDDPFVDASATDCLELSTSQRKITVSVDGEVERIAPPLLFRSEPRSLTVLRPVRTAQQGEKS